MKELRLFVLAYNNTAGDNHVSADSHQNYLLPKVKREDCNIEIDERNSMISQLMTELNNTTKSEKN